MDLLAAGQISQNYQDSYALTSELLQQDFGKRGYTVDPAGAEFNDLVQTVLGHPPVVACLQHIRFERQRYEPVLREAIDAVKRAFFPDVRKKRFLSLDALESDFLVAPSPEERAASEHLPGPAAARVWQDLLAPLAPAARAYFLERLLPNYPELTRYFAVGGRRRQQALETSPPGFAAKIELLQRFYPDGILRFSTTWSADTALCERQIIDTFLNVYLGIERSFPLNFLQRDGARRAAVMVRFLVTEILQTRPEAILAARDETFFIRHGLQNVYRFFNYSANRALHNAFPEMVPPWLHSRCEDQFWEDPSHRIEAVRWLVERRLGIAPEELYRRPVTKADFAGNGLSYLFNQYYNSVSRALAAAYPHLQPWEVGKVPFDFWTGETAGAAIRWMIAQKGWRVEELPKRVRRREFTRKTFSEFGLATLFEKKFAKNIYRAVSAAYPGRFQPWELGRVPSEYWSDAGNVYRASSWIAAKEGLAGPEIAPAIRKRRFTLQHLGKYPIGNALKKWCGGRLERIFAPIFWQEHQVYLAEQKLLRKINALKNAEQQCGLVHRVMYGLFYFDVQRTARRNRQRYERLARRIQRRSILYAD